MMQRSDVSDKCQQWARYAVQGGTKVGLSCLGSGTRSRQSEVLFNDGSPAEDNQSCKQDGRRK